MKRLIAVFLAAMLAMNMIACDAGDLTPEQIEIITKAVDGVNDDWITEIWRNAGRNSARICIRKSWSCIGTV